MFRIIIIINMVALLISCKDANGQKQNIKAGDDKTNSKLENKKVNKIPILSVIAKNCQAEILINNIPFLKKTCDNSFESFGGNIPEYLMNGKNILTIKVNTCSDKNGTFELMLKSKDFSNQLPQENLLVIEETKISESKTYSKEFEFKTENTLTWQRASKITLDKKTLKKLDIFLEKVHNAINNGEGEKINSLLQYFGKDMETLTQKNKYKYDINAWNKQTIKYINNKKAPLIKLKKGSYNLIADGRLINLVGEDNLPLFRSKKLEDGYMWKMAMKIGLINDEFYILLR